MVDVTISIPDKTARTFLADVVPEAILSRTDGKELVIDFAETKEKAKKQRYTFIDGKKKISKKGTGILLEGKNLSILLKKEDIEKIKKLL